MLFAGSVSKLKAQLRQTKRLLARSDLNPDVRVTSERRLVVLEEELAKAEQSNKEKKMVQRYRGVKFFERQKLLRKIKQAKKQLASLPGNADVEKTLLEARIDLYYVLRYPKTEKYIALFPDGTFVPHSPSILSEASPSEQKRQTLRQRIRRQIERGELSPAAEAGDLGIEGEEDVGAGAGAGKRARSEEQEEQREQEVDLDKAEEEVERPAKKQKSSQAEEADEDAAEAAEDVEAEQAYTAPKKLNRKQRKEAKRAKEAVAAAPVHAASPERPAAKKASTSEGPDGAKRKEAKNLAEEDDFFA
ncbi:rRNA-processing protein EFG1 [Rhodotorula toruloides]|uniref:rRNA-processing protein EFG1 n=1 Tax=Rhodotorula toruloides TaxID=5286 RepID=A0A511K954_RHOTO|nr:rRNA-processing protein EFG1 [Rhodotorula toruloides]